VTVSILVPVSVNTETAGDLAGTRVFESLRDRAGDISEALTEIEQIIGSTLHELRRSDGALEVSLKMGMNLQAEGGVVITKVSAAASLEVVLTWKLPVVNPDTAK
jgi:hypothetical protein